MEMTYSLTTSSYESKYSDLQPIFANKKHYTKNSTFFLHLMLKATRPSA